MMNTLTVMKQAIDALNECSTPIGRGRERVARRNKAIANLRTAIAEMERDEPVAWRINACVGHDGAEYAMLTDVEETAAKWPNVTALFTHSQYRDAWRDAVTDKLVICGIYNQSHDNNPRKAIKDIIHVHVQMALDPLISSDAAELMTRGRDSIIEECAVLVETGVFECSQKVLAAAIRALKGKK